MFISMLVFVAMSLIFGWIVKARDKSHKDELKKMEELLDLQKKQHIDDIEMITGDTYSRLLDTLITETRKQCTETYNKNPASIKNLVPVIETHFNALNTMIGHEFVTISRVYAHVENKPRRALVGIKVQRVSKTIGFTYTPTIIRFIPEHMVVNNNYYDNYVD